jgi:hypothetical protein
VPTTVPRWIARSVLLSLVGLVACAPEPPADPLVGKWILNRARSHYGPGAQARKRETFLCEASRGGVRCTIESVRLDGKAFVGRFWAAYDGKPYPATGIPDVDQVRLRRVDDLVADATFSYRGKPVFGYRAIQSDGRGSLTIVSVEPVTRTALNSVVVYDRG